MEEIHINGNIEDISAMLLSAERYAMGRMTYIVGWTCEFIAKNKELLTETDRQVIIRDIKESKYYGMECDETEWLKLLKILEENCYKVVD